MERGKEPWLGQPSETIAILQKYDFVFSKQFGQNFLIDTHVLDKIVDAAGITKDDFVIEIGPGIGTLTQYLAYHAREVLAVEIDHDLIPILSDTLSTYDNVHVINEDIWREEKNLGLDSPQRRLPYCRNMILFLANSLDRIF